MKCSLVMLASGCVLALTACSTHRQDLAVSSGMEPLNGQTLAAARASIQHEVGKADTLRAESLAPLTSAAALIAQITRSPSARSTTRRLAAALSKARIGPDNAFGLASAGRSQYPSAGLTALAGLAFLGAYQATGDPGDLSQAEMTATTLLQPQLGWQDTGAIAGVRSGRGKLSFDIAQTAMTALVLDDVGRYRQPGLIKSGDRGFRMIFDSQVAIGRWYSIRGSHVQMSALQWGETLYALQQSRLSEAKRIARAGIPAIASAEFKRSGRPAADAASDPVGAAAAAAAIASYPVPSIGEAVSSTILGSRRSDGTIALAAAADDPAQAWFALALAQRLETIQAAG